MVLSSHSRRRFRDIAALVDLADEESEVTATTSLVQRSTRPAHLPIIEPINEPIDNFTSKSNHNLSFVDQLKHQTRSVISIDEESDYFGGEVPHLSEHLLQQHSSDDSSSHKSCHSFETYSQVHSSAELSMEANPNFWGGSTQHRFSKTRIAMQQLEEESETDSAIANRFESMLRSRFSSPDSTEHIYPSKHRELALNATDSTDSCTVSSRTTDHPQSSFDSSSSANIPQQVEEEEEIPAWKLKQRMKMRASMGLMEEAEEVMQKPIPVSPISHVSSNHEEGFEVCEEDCPSDCASAVPSDCASAVPSDCASSVPESPVRKLEDQFEEQQESEGTSVASKSYMDDPSLHEQRRLNSKVLDVRRSLTKATPIEEDSDDGVQMDDAETDSVEESEATSSVSDALPESPPLPPPADWWMEMGEKVERYHKSVLNKSTSDHDSLDELRISFEGFAESQNQLGRAMAVALFQGIEAGQQKLEQKHERELQELQEKHEREMQALREQFAAGKTNTPASPNVNNAQRNEAFRQKWKSRMSRNLAASTRNTDVASTVVSNMSCRELSVQRYRERILRQMNKGRSPTPYQNNDAASEVSSIPTTTSEKETKENAQEIQRLLDELQNAEHRQKLLEKQLHQAGVVLAEDIPYQLAKDKVAAISKRMNEIGSSGVVHEDALIQKQLREEYFRLEKDMQKYLSALMLTDEFAQEQRAAAEQWEAKHAKANQAALDAIRKHMPLDIRTLSAQQLEEDRGLPKHMVQKFRRTNVLQLLRVDPSVVCKWHPSTLEAFRVTGLTLTERRAIHCYLLLVAKTWRGSTQGLTASTDPMTTRKLQWYDMLRNNFKEAVERYERHLGGTNGVPRRHIQSTCLCNRCNLIGNQCPVRANKAMDYFATDLGFAYRDGDKIYEDAKIIAGGKNDAKPKSAAEVIAEARSKNAEDCVYVAPRTPIRPKPIQKKAPTKRPKHPLLANKPKHPLMAKGPAKPAGLLAAIAARRVD